MTRKSKAIKLAIIGSASLLVTACEKLDDTPENINREFYTNQQDCADDWNRDDCEQGESKGVYGYWGPYYTSTGHVYRLNGNSYQSSNIAAIAARNQFHSEYRSSSIVPRYQLSYSGDGVYASSPKARAQMGISGRGFRSGGFGSFGRSGFGG